MKMRRILSVLLALVLVVTMNGMCVKAADAGVTKNTLEEATMKKELTVADGIDITAVKTFKFSFTAAGSDTATADEHPAITEQTIEVGAVSGGKATGTLTLDQVFTNANAFPHAGEYIYTVKETTTASNTTENGVTKVLTVDSAEYKVHVYVINDTQGLKFDGVTVEKDGEKIDPTTDETKFVFKNEYKETIEENEDGVLKVTKSITGDYGDKTKKFTVTVTLVLPELATADDVAVAAPATFDAQTLTATAELSDGESIKFTKLPAGTTFTVGETQQDPYKSKITGDVETPDTDYVAGDRADVKGKAPITEAGVEVSVENNREDIIPTGIIINNLAYILLVLAAVIGFAYLSLKKRARNF